MDQNQFGGPASADFGEAKQVPPSPQTPEVKLRTMESDVSSVEKTGGVTPAPEFIASPASPSLGGPIFQAGTGDQTAASPEAPEEKPGMSLIKKLALWLVIVLITLGTAIIGYYYVWPIFGPIEEQGQVTTPEPVPIPAPQPVEEPTPPPVAPAIHVSHFGFPNEVIPKIVLSDYGVLAILTALQNEAGKAGAPGELREILIVDNQDQPVAFSKFMAALMPELTANNLETTLRETFEDDFTAYLYFDSQGVWPGYSVKTKPDVDIDIVTLQNELGGLELASFNNLFLTPPGTTQEFRTGTVKDVYTNRFAPLSKPGASFNYGLFDGRLIINTSYAGLLKSLELIGL